MKKAFTLIELLVAAAILTIMASIVLINLDKGKAKSRDAQRKTDLANIAQALDTYKIDKKYYPQCNGTIRLSSEPNILTNELVGNKYLVFLPHDPKEKSDGTGIYYYSYQGNIAGSGYRLTALSETISDADIKNGENTCIAAECCALPVLKQKAGDYCYPKSPKKFQISSSETARDW